MRTKTMTASELTISKSHMKQSKSRKFMKEVIKNRFLFVLAIPGLLYFLIFKYLPMWGILIAFQDYSPYMGMMKSPWVGFEHFIRLFTHEDFAILMRNTLAINFLSLIFYFPAPIIISILLNEVRSNKYKRIIQTAVYFPHFLSWVIIAGITYAMLSQSGGLINELLEKVVGFRIPFMSEPKYFWALLVGQSMWKEAGWGTVIFLASITGIDPSLYESARMDGATRFRQMWHITLPGIKNVMITLLILRIGHVMDVGIDQVFLMSNPVVANVAEVFDTYVFRVGVRSGQFSYSTAVGLFKSIIGLLMVIMANHIAKSVGEEGIY